MIYISGGKMHLKYINILILLIFFIPSLAYTEGLQTSNIDSKASSLPRIEISSVSGLERYIDLLQYPSYLAVALLNNDIKFSHCSDLTLLDKHALKISFITLRFISKNGQRFLYTAEILKGVDSQFNFNIEVDVSEVKLGKIYLHIISPLTKIITQARYDRINQEIQRLSDKKHQEKLISYFKDLEKKISSDKKAEEGIMEMILMDGINRKSTEVSAKKSTFDYASKLLPLAIIGLLIVYVFKKRK